MWERIKRFLLPPVFEGDREKTNSAQLVYGFLLIIISAAVLYPLLSITLGNPIGSTTTILVGILITATIASLLLLRFGYILTSGMIVCLVMWAVFTFGSYGFGGLHDTAITGLFILVILASMIGGWHFLVLFAGLSIVSLLGLYYLEHTKALIPDIAIPPDASEVALPVVIIIGATILLRTFTNHLTSAYEEARSGEAQLAEANLVLENSRDELVQQTDELERRTRYLEATSAVARDVASELDPEILIRRIVILVTEQFNFYHTGLFLIETGAEYAVLRASSSEGGQRMLERDHRLRVGEEGIVGFVASQGRSRVALDTGVDAVYFNNPDLPDTRSEAALPLRVRGQVIGVLDVQSTQPEAFNNDDIAVLQTLADQIAVALQTAQLFQQVEQSLEAQRQAYGDVSQEAWKNITEGRDHLGYRYLRGDIVSVDEQRRDDQPGLPEISLPVQIGEQTIGYITAHKSSSETEWTTSEVAIMETLSDQLGVALESARLYQDTQLRAAREQLTGKVTTRIRETMDIETIIKTASEEIRKALDLPEVVIRLGEPTTNPKRGVTE